jgi:hypothetical protein
MARLFSSKEIIAGKNPTCIETLSAPNILSRDDIPPEVRHTKLGSDAIELPPFSLCRVIWD